MFQPETEDMLPRLAPKPSPNVLIGVCDGIIRPQVPEVSILFGQQDTNIQQHTLNITSQQQQSETKSFPAQSYAAWKKQMLPKVNYLAPANMADIQIQENNIMVHDYNSPRTNLYPIRPVPAQPVSMPVNVNGYVGTSAEVNQMTYRRSTESGTSNAYQQPMHPLSTLNQLPNTKDILTLCAGTQTDTVLDSNNCLQHCHSDPMSNFASKKDVENIRNILDEVKVEQQRLGNLLETFLYNHHSQIIVKPQCRDVGVQVDCIENEEQCSDIESIQVKQPQATKHKFLQHIKSANTLQTHNCKPMAQSTAYRPNSPQLQLLERELAANQHSSKSSSDTSLAMNELALKYLPNEKLTELLKELNMDCPLLVADKIKSPAPVRTNINKFEKSSSDISNASYKYLKKYRLLPEDQEEKNNNVGILGEGEHVDQDQILHYNSPQYNNNLKMNQRQTPCSPYTGRLPLSPLVKASQSPLQSSEKQHIVDLENIKQQPKLL